MKGNDYSGGFMGKWTRDNVRPEKLNPHAVRHDKWDKQDYLQLLSEMVELAASEGRLAEFIETGHPLFGDNFYSLAKAAPKLNPPGEVRPSHLLNRAVMGEAMELPEWEALRSACTGDEIGAALAAIAMEPEIETLIDRLEQERKLMQELMKKEQEAAQRDQESRDLDEMWKEWMENNDPSDPENQGEVQDYQQRKDLINQALEQLRQEIAQGAEQLQKSLKSKQGIIRQAMKEAINEGQEEATNTDMASVAWGLDRGTLLKMDVQERLTLAQRMNNPKLKEMANLIGPMRHMAFAEQNRKTLYARDEVYDISLGGDLSRVLPSELLSMSNPLLRKDFYRRFVEGGLLQYELRGEEKVAKGGIVCCEDGSGSMSGEPELFSKAVSLVLMHLARQQKRSFYGIHFGSPGEYKTYDFRDPTDVDFEDVLSWAELFFCGGTDFHTPLSVALDLLEEEYEKEGAVKADIVFITDGMCGVDENWLADLKEKQQKMGFKIWGIIIGHGMSNPESEPLKTISDGRVFTIQDLKSGEDVRTIFRNV